MLTKTLKTCKRHLILWCFLATLVHCYINKYILKDGKCFVWVGETPERNINFCAWWFEWMEKTMEKRGNHYFKNREKRNALDIGIIVTSIIHPGHLFSVWKTHGYFSLLLFNLWNWLNSFRIFHEIISVIWDLQLVSFPVCTPHWWLSVTYQHLWVKKYSFVLKGWALFSCSEAYVLHVKWGEHVGLTLPITIFSTDKQLSEQSHVGSSCDPELSVYALVLIGGDNIDAVASPLQFITFVN